MARFASLLSACGQQMAGHEVTASAAIDDPRRDVLDGLAADEITLPVQRVYPLEDVPRAFGDFAAGTLGELAATTG